MMRKVGIGALALLCMAVLAPASVYAHTGGAHAGGFANGFAHPLDGLDHILVMVAVGIWGVRVVNRAGLGASVAMVLMVALGAAGFFAAYHGLAHGHGLSYTGGVFIATVFLNACGAGAGLMLRRFERFFLARHAGPVLAAVGLLLFSFGG